MQEFEKQLDDLLASKKDTKKSEMQEVDEAIAILIERNLLATMDYEAFLLTLEARIKNIYHVAAKGVAAAFEKFPAEKQSAFVESLISTYDRSLTYQLIARLLHTGLVEEGMRMLSHCCERITDSGKKIPAKGLQTKLHAALFLIPDLREKPIKVILDGPSLTKNVIISILPILLDTKFQSKQKGNYPLFKEKILLHAHSTWKELPSEDRQDYKVCLSPYLEGKHLDDFIVNKDVRLEISDEFVSEFHLIGGSLKEANGKTDEIAGNCIPAPPAKANGGNKNRAAMDEVPVLKKEEAIAAVPAEYSPSKTSHKRTLSDAIPVLEDILSWVEESPVNPAKKLLAMLEDIEEIEATRVKQIEQGSQKIAILNDKIEALSSDNIALKNKLQSLKKDLDTKDGKIEALKDQMQTMGDTHQMKISEIIRESQEKESRTVQQIKNQIASRLQPLVNDFYLLKSESDLKEKCEGQYKIFNNIIVTLQKFFNIQVKKDE